MRQMQYARFEVHVTDDTKPNNQPTKSTKPTQPLLTCETQWLNKKKHFNICGDVDIYFLCFASSSHLDYSVQV